MCFVKFTGIFKNDTSSWSLFNLLSHLRPSASLQRSQSNAVLFIAQSLCQQWCERSNSNILHYWQLYASILFYILKSHVFLCFASMGNCSRVFFSVSTNCIIFFSIINTSQQRKAITDFNFLFCSLKCVLTPSSFSVSFPFCAYLPFFPFSSLQHPPIPIHPLPTRSLPRHHLHHFSSPSSSLSLFTRVPIS